MSSTNTSTPPMGPTDRIAGRNFQIFPYDRRRKSHRDPKSSWVTVVTVAATVVSCVAAFSSSRPSGFVTVQRATRPSTSLRPSFLVEKRTTQCLPLPTSTRLFSSSAPNSDKDEWRALISAFQMYKAAYGDLKVPSRFVVPSMPPWPEAAWEMKLGQKVAGIRATGKYIQNNPKRRKSLESLGFVWRVRQASQSQGFDTAAGVTFDQLYDALVIYRKEIQPKGALTVPSEFVVPNEDPWPENTRGLPLGMSMPKIQSKSFLKDDPDAEDKLHAIGVQMDNKVAANDTRFQNVCDGLTRYKEIHGDMLVPQPFIVPEKSKDWPEDTWGLRLGARVNAIRSQGTFVKASPERKKQLDDLGFVWVPPQTERRKRGRKSKAEKEQEELEMLAQAGSQTDEDGEMEALDSLFGTSFDFGTEPLFPDGVDDEKIAKTWGFEGGKELQEVVAAQEEAQQQAQDDYKPEKDLAQTLAEATVRAEEAGIIEQGGGGKNMTKAKREKNIPWFNDDFGGEFVFEDVVEALTLYQSFFGDFSNLTNEEFVIPLLDEPMSTFDDDDDDSSMFDSDASSRAAAAIARFEESEDLIEAENGRLSDKAETEAAIAVRRLEVEADWPEHLEGMRVGSIVKRIRDGSLEVKHLPERKAKLDAIDFDWGDSKYFIDIPFEKAMCAMYAYYLVRGDMFVRESFVMPDQDPWPQVFAGYELGLAVKRIRELQNFFEAYHAEKVSLLRMIDFVWFPTLAFPLDPNEPEMTPERLLLCAMGHPDYAKMIEIPMGLPEKIIADGPFFETDDPKLWWRKWHNWDYVKDYWYQNGRRDNARMLRDSGYPDMAAEHEEKYGPGLFTQIEDTMDQLQDEVEDQIPKEKEELVEKLKFYRSELDGCKDLPADELDELIEDIDVQLLELMTGKKSNSVGEALEAALEEYEDEEVEYEGEEVEDEEEGVEEEDFNIEEELQ